ncbi:MAG: hypothetical protein IH840_15985 [Candidatus Heimdallarchaeota archaeon]|nr:hypothetical protein [Candidatus Heimdallarchaeota archaeon]
MSLTYKLLGAQGEIHLSLDQEFTMCGIRCSHQSWANVENKPDKNPQMCVDCLQLKNNGGTPASEKAEKVTKTPTAKKVEGKILATDKKTEPNDDPKPKEVSKKKAVKVAPKKTQTRTEEPEKPAAVTVSKAEKKAPPKKKSTNTQSKPTKVKKKNST